MAITKCGFELARSEEEKELLEQFIARLEGHSDRFGDTQVDDQMALRFLRARALDLDRAEEMFLTSLEWRRQQRADHLLAEYKPAKKEIKSYLTGGVHKTDRDGDPVLYDRLGQLDVKGVVKAFGEEELVRYDIYKQEKMEALFRSETARQGRLVDRVTCVMDLSGLSLKHVYAPGIQVFKQLVANGEGNYPERLKRCMVINAPSIFPRVWSLVKGFFDPRTQKKIFILGSNFREELLKYIPEENLPQYLGGGSSIDGDPHCKADIAPGGAVPHHLYQGVVDDDDEGEKTIVVKAGAFHVHNIEALENQVLKWKFKTEAKDIAFELSLVKEDGNEVPIVGKERLKCDTNVGVEGEHRVSSPGKYVFKWDNTFSWAKSKTLTYGIERRDSEELREGRASLS